MTDLNKDVYGGADSAPDDATKASDKPAEKGAKGAGKEDEKPSDKIDSAKKP